MATYTYTVRVTDFGERPLPDAQLRVWVEADRDAHSPSGQLSKRRIPVVIDSSGVGSVQLVASADTSPPIKYTLRGDWVTITESGQEILAGWSEWPFTALPGGGPIQDGVNAPPSIWWVGPPFPVTEPPGFYWDLTTDDIGVKGVANGPSF